MKALLLFVCTLCCIVQIYPQISYETCKLGHDETIRSGWIRINLYNPNPFLYKRDVTIAGIVTDTSTDNMSSITAILPSTVPLADFTEAIAKVNQDVNTTFYKINDEVGIHKNRNKSEPNDLNDQFETLFKIMYNELNSRMDKVKNLNNYRNKIKPEINNISACKRQIVTDLLLNDSLTEVNFLNIHNNLGTIIQNSEAITTKLGDILQENPIDNNTISDVRAQIQSMILQIVVTGKKETYKDLIQYVEDTYKEIVTTSEKIGRLHDSIVKTIQETRQEYQQQAVQLRLESIMVTKMKNMIEKNTGHFVYTFETGNLDEIEVIVETSAKKDTVFPSSYGLVTHNYMPTRVEVYHILLTGRARISFNPQLYVGGIFTPSVYYRETYDQSMETYRYTRETHTAFEIGVMTNMNLMWRLSKCFGMGVGIGAGVNLPVSGHVPVNLRLGGSVSFLFGRYDRFSLNAYFLAGVIRQGIDRNMDETMDYTSQQAFSYVHGMGLGAGLGLGINIYKYRKNTELAKRTF